MTGSLSVSFEIVSEISVTEHSDMNRTRASKGKTIVGVVLGWPGLIVNLDFIYQQSMSLFSAQDLASRQLNQWAKEYNLLIARDISFIKSAKISAAHGTITAIAKLSSGNTAYKDIHIEVPNAITPEDVEQEGLALIRQFLMEVEQYKS